MVMQYDEFNGTSLEAFWTIDDEGNAVGTVAGGYHRTNVTNSGGGYVTIGQEGITEPVDGILDIYCKVTLPDKEPQVLVGGFRLSTFFDWTTWDGGLGDPWAFLGYGYVSVPNSDTPEAGWWLEVYQDYNYPAYISDTYVNVGYGTIWLRQRYVEAEGFVRQFYSMTNPETEDNWIEVTPLDAQCQMTFGVDFDVQYYDGCNDGSEPVEILLDYIRGWKPLRYDEFNDDVIADFWGITESGTGTVSETNGNMVMTVGATGQAWVDQGIPGKIPPSIIDVYRKVQLSSPPFESASTDCQWGFNDWQTQPSFWGDCGMALGYDFGLGDTYTIWGWKDSEGTYYNDAFVAISSDTVWQRIRLDSTGSYLYYSETEPLENKDWTELVIDIPADWIPSTGIDFFMSMNPGSGNTVTRTSWIDYVRGWQEQWFQWDDIHYYRSTQAMANRLPDWTRGQNEKYSNIQQLLQTTGKELEATIESMRRAANSLFLRSMDMRSIDLTYQIELPYSFEFEFDFTDPTNPRPKPPDVWGIINNTTYPIEAIFENDIASFWYEPIGNRVSLGPDELAHDVSDASKLTTGDVLPAINISIGKLVATYSDPLVPGRLYVTIAGGDTTKFGFKNNRINMPGYVELRGTTVKDSEETERLAFTFDSTLITRKFWKEITDVIIYNIEPITAQITITSAAGTLQQSPDPGYIDYDTVGPKLTFWEIDVVNLQAVLQQISTVSRVVTSEVSMGFQLDVFREWMLINATGFAMSFATIVDYAFETYRPYMYVLTDDGLVQVFNKLPEYPDLDSIRLLKQRTDGTKTVIQASYDEGILEDQIRISAKTLTKTKPVAFYYLEGAKPHDDGTLQYIGEDGTWGSTRAEALVSLATPSVNIPYHPLLLDLEEVGCYTFILTTRYIDGTEDKDVKIIWSRYKMPIASFDLMAADPTLTIPLAICFDYNHRLWVGGMYGGEFKFKILNHHADLMLIDYDKKLLYLREEYDSIWVGEDEATTSTTTTTTTTT